MSESILIGTRGWQDPRWADGYYPPELPPDWRFCFYSNRLRSVLVPGEVLADLEFATATQWMEDSDPAFRFVLELPPQWLDFDPVVLGEAYALFRERTGAIHSRTAGLILRAGTAPSESWLEGLIRAIGDDPPLTVDLAPALRTAALLAICASSGSGWCWRCDEEDTPPPSGRLTVALASPAPPRAVRRILELLSECQGEAGRAALFFDGVGAASAAEEARILAELMAV